MPIPASLLKILTVIATTTYLGASLANAQPIPKDALAEEDRLAEELSALVQAKGTDAGIVFLQKKLGDNPENEVARFFFSTALLSQGKTKECAQVVLDGEKKHVTSDRLLGVLWSCLEEAGDRDGALVVAQSAVKRFPESGESHRCLGISFLYQKRHPEALEQLRQAFTLDSSDSTSLYMIAQLYRRESQTYQSLLTYLRFFSLEPYGNRSRKARQQFASLLQSRLDMKPVSGTSVEMSLSLEGEGKTAEGDFTGALRMIGAQLPNLDPDSDITDLSAAKLEMAIAGALDVLPTRDSVKGPSFTLDVLVPFFRQASEGQHLAAICQLVVQPDDKWTEDSTELVRWSLSYKHASK